MCCIDRLKSQSLAAPHHHTSPMAAFAGKAAARSAAFYELQQAANGQERTFAYSESEVAQGEDRD